MNFLTSTIHDGWSKLVKPMRETARDYSAVKLRRDVVAGITVAVVAIPQSMAFALLAEVDPVYGLYTAMIQAVIAAFVNSSEHVAVGPTNTQSLLIASVATRLVGGQPEMFIAIGAMLALLKGIVQLGMAVAGLSQLVKYVSLSVILGFTTGAELLIALGQVPNFLGLPAYQGERWRSGLIDAAVRTWAGIEHVQLWAVGFGVASLVIILVCRRISKFVPGPLIAIAATAVAAVLVGMTPANPLLLGDLPQSLPTWAPPFLHDGLTRRHMEQLILPAIAIAVLGLIEQVAISKAIATHTGQRINANRECVAQGVSNLISSFFQCFCGSASFSRSALNLSAGAATRLAGLFSGVAVAVTFLLLAGQARYIPKASLAALLFVVAFGLFDAKKTKRVLTGDRSDALVFITTLLATLLLPLEYAIYVGIGLNMALYLRKASHLHITELIPSGRHYQERPLDADDAGDREIVFLQLEGDLFFAVADELRDRLVAVINQGPRVIVLRLKRTHSIDGTVLDVLDRVVTDFRQRGGSLVVCGLRPELLEQLRSYGLDERIGRENIFETVSGIFASAQQAMARAQQIVAENSRREAEPAPAQAPELGAWMYEI